MPSYRNVAETHSFPALVSTALNFATVARSLETHLTTKNGTSKELMRYFWHTAGIPSSVRTEDVVYCHATPYFEPEMFQVLQVSSNLQVYSRNLLPRHAQAPFQPRRQSRGRRLPPPTTCQHHPQRTRKAPPHSSWKQS